MACGTIESVNDHARRGSHAGDPGVPEFDPLGWNPRSRHDRAMDRCVPQLGWLPLQ